jgi:hypothetical protein
VRYSRPSLEGTILVLQKMVRGVTMKTLLSFIFVFGVLMTLGCMDGAPAACGICENECPCVEADCICDIDICKCSNCIS